MRHTELHDDAIRSIADSDLPWLDLEVLCQSVPQMGTRHVRVTIYPVKHFPNGIHCLG
jgi:hypothetical protein